MFLFVADLFTYFFCVFVICCIFLALFKEYCWLVWWFEEVFFLKDKHYIFHILETKYYNMVKLIVCRCYRHKNYSNNRNRNWIPNGNTFMSLGAWVGVLPILTSITSTEIQTAPNFGSLFIVLFKSFTVNESIPITIEKEPICLSFKISHISLYVLTYLIRCLLRKPHHCDDAIFLLIKRITLPNLFLSLYFGRRVSHRAY